MKYKVEQFISEFKKNWAYELLAQTLNDEAIFLHTFNQDGSVCWMKAQTKQMWDLWHNTNLVPEGFVLLPEDPCEDMLWAAWEAPPISKPSTNRRDFNERLTIVYKAMSKAHIEKTKNPLSDSTSINWELAPAWAEIWVMSGVGQAWWGAGDLETWRPNLNNGWSATGFNVKTEIAPSFDFSGDWRESLIKRPKNL